MAEGVVDRVALLSLPKAAAVRVLPVPVVTVLLLPVVPELLVVPLVAPTVVPPGRLPVEPVAAAVRQRVP
jgi:hypothetical protein